MGVNKRNSQLIILCGLAVCINVVLGSIVTITGVPLLFLDALGTIFISINFNLMYGVMTGLCTNLVLTIFFGPLALPFALVNMTVAVVANLCTRNDTRLTYSKAILVGIALALVGSLVSGPIRLWLYGGFRGITPTLTNVLVVTLKASGLKLLNAAYWGAVSDSFFDKIISCLIVFWLSRLPVIHKKVTFLNQKGRDYHEWTSQNR
ncbi:hypothetical protein [Vagococcus penaei]|uniref:ECF transporter S component n=1 Tax=Vagococcus penaei TaxID=633807 RepID=A0A1Q2D5D2_9ENTE|nr:hypothetical protein [Vagococcus penaei]AQP53584.1 hypothetical protein BW732_04625 [Vagococcus penaei]